MKIEKKMGAFKVNEKGKDREREERKKIQTEKDQETKK